MSTNLAPEHAAPLTMRCPKCAGDMATYERSGIHVDQCRECRGIFLDRGELERLVDAESNGAGWGGPIMNPPAPIPPSPTRDPRIDQRDDPRYDPRYDQRTAQHDGDRPAWFGDDDDDDDDRGRRRMDDGSDRSRSDDRGGPPRKRKGILGDLLEGLGD